jgi:hypothetical protein
MLEGRTVPRAFTFCIRMRHNDSERYHDDAQIAKITSRHDHAAQGNKAIAVAFPGCVLATSERRMMPLFGTSEHWLARAQEARDMAENIADPEAKRAMLEIAANYEKVAKRAEARDAGIPFPPHERH